MLLQMLSAQGLTVESLWHSIKSSEKIRTLNSSISLSLSSPVKPTYKSRLTQATFTVSVSLLILEKHKLSVGIILTTSALQRKVDEPLHLQSGFKTLLCPSAHFIKRISQHLYHIPYSASLPTSRLYKPKGDFTKHYQRAAICHLNSEDKLQVSFLGIMYT